MVAPDAVDHYPAAARPALEYPSVLRGRSAALTDLAQWDAEPNDLDQLVEAGVLIGFPARDETAVREVLASLALAITAKTKIASDGKTLLLLLLPTSALSSWVRRPWPSSAIRQPDPSAWVSPPSLPKCTLTLTGSGDICWSISPPFSEPAPAPAP